MSFFLLIIFFWAASLFFLWKWKKDLFISTWNEPYFSDTPVLIESDDWGPGGQFHSERLNRLLGALTQHRDSVNRPAILTANVVLSVPDLEQIDANPGKYFRKTLKTDFPGILNTMLSGMNAGNFVPQLHGLEHLNGRGFSRLWHEQDSRMPLAEKNHLWWDWESLDSPLQGHYVDGSQLPTISIDRTEAEEIIRTATSTFAQTFGYPTLTTTAPCYLWNSQIEEIWSEYEIRGIQTAGYRCIGRDSTGDYIQSPALIRPGQQTPFKQVYLVRNVMFEPVDGKHTVQSALEEAKAAYRQALPVCISTHRYNYTRSEQECLSTVADLSQLLSLISSQLHHIRYLASPELSEFLSQTEKKIVNQFNRTTWDSLQLLPNNKKIGSFLYRLYYRHPKLKLFCFLTGLFIPAGILMTFFRK